jgi:hypothetical protein
MKNNLQDELMTLMDQKGISWFGFKVKKGTKTPTFTSYDGRIKEVLGKTLYTDNYEVIISQYVHAGKEVKDQYVVNFQPIK